MLLDSISNSNVTKNAFRLQDIHHHCCWSFFCFVFSLQIFASILCWFSFCLLLVSLCFHCHLGFLDAISCCFCLFLFVCLFFNCISESVFMSHLMMLSFFAFCFSFFWVLKWNVIRKLTFFLLLLFSVLRINECISVWNAFYGFCGYSVDSMIKAKSESEFENHKNHMQI